MTDARAISRRSVLSSAGRLALGTAAAGALASCHRGAPTAFSWADRSMSGVLDFANWPFYIDRTESGDHPSLDLFKRRTGIDVRYTRPIRGNAEFLTRIRPDLEAGRPTGYDLVVLTNGPELSTMLREGWAVPLDHAYLHNFSRNASPLVRDPPWDRRNRHTVAWQSGLTGIAYRPEAAHALGREPTSVQDLWDRAVAGRVGMMTDLMDLGSAGLLALGIEPETSQPDDWTAAAEVLERQHDDGIVRAYYDQGYLHALLAGEVWIAQAWSGDIFQAHEEGHRDLRFVIPKEGALFWTDNLLIPAHAQHPVDAVRYMDFVYDPRVAAMITEWVGYISPVPAAKRIIRRGSSGSSMARSDLVFPEADAIGNGSALKRYPTLSSAADEAAWRDTFGAVLRL
jgi:spermidine/putrescine transport system substrate-binding protein